MSYSSSDTGSTQTPWLTRRVGRCVPCVTSPGLDGTGRFAVVETAKPEGLAEATAKFGTYLDLEFIPVNVITETTRLLTEGVDPANLYRPIVGGFPR